MDAPSRRFRAELEALLAGARAEHRALLAHVPDDLRESLPVDATGVTQAIDVLADAVGIGDDIRAERDRLNRLNAAVLHARVFGRAPLSPETVIAAFADGARGRGPLLERLAREIGGEPLRGEVAALLAAHPPPAAAPGSGVGDEEPVAALRATYAAQERAAVLCAAGLDARRG